MPTTITLGIFSLTAGDYYGDYLDETMVTMNTDVAERRGTNGDIKKVKNYNATNDFNVKGGGQPAAVIGISSNTITGLTGGIKNVPKFVHTEKNTDFDDFEAAGKHYPNGSAG